MEWHQLIQGALASSPLALVLAFACHRLWTKVEQKDQALAEKDKEIARLSEARVQDLMRIAQQND